MVYKLYVSSLWHHYRDIAPRVCVPALYIRVYSCSVYLTLNKTSFILSCLMSFFQNERAENCRLLEMYISLKHWPFKSCILLHAGNIKSSSCISSGPWFNIKMASYQYRKSHCGDKTVVRSSYLHNGISYPGKMSSFNWIETLILWTIVWSR